MPWYFAYGSNMQSATLRGRRGITWTRAVPVRVPDWTVVFDKPPMIPMPHSYANLLPEPAGLAYGVAFEVSDEDLAHIELTEGVSFGNYRRACVAVEPLGATDDPPREACTLTADRRDATLVPSTRYMALIIEGALEHGLPEAWVAVLRAVPCRPEDEQARAMRARLDDAMRRLLVTRPT